MPSIDVGGTSPGARAGSEAARALLAARVGGDTYKAVFIEQCERVLHDREALANLVHALVVAGAAMTFITASAHEEPPEEVLQRLSIVMARQVEGLSFNDEP